MVTRQGVGGVEANAIRMDGYMRESCTIRVAPTISTDRQIILPSFTPSVSTLFGVHLAKLGMPAFEDGV